MSASDDFHFEFECRNLYHQFRLEKEDQTETTTTTTSTSSSSNFLFEIRMRKISQWIIRSSEIEDFVYDESLEPNTIVRRFSLNPDIFKYDETTIRYTLYNYLSSLQIDDPNIQLKLMKRIASFGTELVNQETNKGHQNINNYLIHMDCVICDVYVYESMSDIERTWMESSNNQIKMIPASRSSINKLEKIEFHGEDSQLTKNTTTSCSICLEEFKKGLILKKMPCSHMFHIDCITQWLQTSHYCPVCRFQMPT